MARERIRLGAGYRKLYVATALSNIGDGMSVIAYPWLATAVTRNPLLIALVPAAQRLPWLVFTLPAGVITDRVDRKRAMVTMDVLRGALTMVVALGVLSQQHTLPAPDQLQQVVGTRAGLYLMLLIATLLLGTAEVLRDNSAQTFLPSVVDAAHLERANGRMWSIEALTNTFIGPPVGSLLIGVAFALPFFVDAGSFFAAAALVALIPGVFRAAVPEGAPADAGNWRSELKEGFAWLWKNPVLRTMAIALGLMNLATNISGAVFVLFAQDVLHVSARTFSFMAFGFATGAIVGGYTAPWLSKRLGSGPCLGLAVGSMAITQTLVGFTSWWVLTAVIFAIGTLLGTTWNVVTVSLRQTVIPPHLLGRVNSVYRFFGWGMMPLGAVLGGLVVGVAGHFVSHTTSLRMVWFVDGGIHVILFVVVTRFLTTERLEALRATAVVANA